jgi:hypothetical protein
MKAGNIEQYKHLSHFHDLKDFNNNIEQWMIDLKSKFTKSELIALKRLIRYSSNIAGVCNAKIQTLVSACHKAGQEISRSTFERMLRKAKKFGLIKVVNTFKENGKQSHNVYVFQRYQIVSDMPTNDVPKQETIDAPNKTINLFKTSNHINKRYTGTEAEFVSNRVPKQFRNLVSCFYNKANVIEELWKVVKCATNKLNYTLAEITEMACDCFRQLIRLVKNGKVRKSIYACLWGIINNKLDEMYFEELYELDFAM